MYKKISLFVAIVCIPVFFVTYQQLSFKSSEEIRVTDFSCFYHACVDRIEYPENVSELQSIVVKADKPIAIAGGKYSMGGQAWCNDGIVIDMKHLNAITAFDPENKIITIQAGACWRDVQEFLEKYQLTVMIMQSYNDFSVGGSLSVNVHGRDPHGQIIESVDSIQVLLADGSLKQASRTKNEDLFRAAIGGYGACGIIVNVTLRVESNYKIKRVMVKTPIHKFTDFFRNVVANDSNVALFNANIYEADFKNIVSFVWYKTNDPLTIFDVLHKGIKKLNIAEKSLPFALEYAVSEFSLAKKLRFLLDAKIIKKINHVVWRSYEMSESVTSLAASSKSASKILQEYFIPVAKFNTFASLMNKIIVKHKIKVLNISIRHVQKNNESILSYAREDCFAFVFYIAMDNNSQCHEQTQFWTQELISAALTVDGTYYLPYHLFASPEQFLKSYPRYPELLKIKEKYDPMNKFQNNLTQKCEECCNLKKI